MKYDLIKPHLKLFFEYPLFNNKYLNEERFLTR